jgi:hypothetical protein
MIGQTFITGNDDNLGHFSNHVIFLARSISDAGSDVFIKNASRKPGMPIASATMGVPARPSVIGARADQ